LRRLVLVRHAAVELVEGVPPSEWRLTDEGHADARRLAALPVFGDVALVATSPEGKARGTARPIAAPIRVEEDLREVERRRTFVVARSAYVDLVDRYFAGGRVEGWEPVADARARIVGCIERLLADTAGDLVVVSHGLVLSLYLADLRGQPRVDLAEWEAIPLPAVAVVGVAARRILAPWRGA
jgi:broad specificity phosphatase PhoE